jgi:YHS domain-containing protein
MMEYVIMANRPFEEIEARTMDALKRQGFVVQRTFSLGSATGADKDSAKALTGAVRNPGYSVLLLYSTGARRQPLGLVTLYERQGKTVINSLPTSPVVGGSQSLPGNKDVEAELTVALALGGLDGSTELAEVFAVSPDGSPPRGGHERTRSIKPRHVVGQETEPSEEVITMLKDPVCGKRINRHRAQAAIEHEGTVYYVCCPLCQTQFERDPARYARPEWGQKARPAKKGRKR